MHPRPSRETSGPVDRSFVVICVLALVRFESSWQPGDRRKESRPPGRTRRHDRARGKPNTGQVSARTVGRMQRPIVAGPASERPLRGDQDHKARAGDRRCLGGRTWKRHGAARAIGVGDPGDPDRARGGRRGAWGRRGGRAWGRRGDRAWGRCGGRAWGRRGDRAWGRCGGRAWGRCGCGGGATRACRCGPTRATPGRAGATQASATSATSSGPTRACAGGRPRRAPATRHPQRAGPSGAVRQIVRALSAGRTARRGAGAHGGSGAHGSAGARAGGLAAASAGCSTAAPARGLAGDFAGPSGARCCCAPISRAGGARPCRGARRRTRQPRPGAPSSVLAGLS